MLGKDIVLVGVYIVGVSWMRWEDKAMDCCGYWLTYRWVVWQQIE